MNAATSLPRAGTPSAAAAAAAAAPEPRAMMDVLYDGFYLVFLLRNGQAPETIELLREQVKAFMVDVERHAHKLGVSEADLRLIRYAFCCTLDEVLLRSDSALRYEWQRQPLQMLYFGDQLGGESFFAQLEAARREGAARLQVLEVFHMCLLMGFQGKYVFEGLDQLAHLTARLGDEIAHLKGRRPSFAPHWARPDQVSHRLRTETPLWVICFFFALLGLLAFAGLRFDLARQTSGRLAGYQQLVKVAPEPAHVTITLP